MYNTFYVVYLGNSQNNGRSAFSKVDKPQRKNSVEKIPGKKPPINTKLKGEEINIKQNEVSVECDVKLADIIETTTSDCSLEANIEYEDDFEVKIIKIYHKNQ